ncbi:uncharacterized protein LOC135471336 [Liolophura sinensis]|uniref:uncharacterized protein LOC135471336 n=1 Tax=Liolophura sinensis TaxID=3198878 RepID=UPI003158A283
MVYTLKVNGTTVDATMVDNLSERFLKAHLALEGPRKQYQFYTMDSITQLSYTRYGYSFAFHLTNKLDAENIALVQTELTQMIAGKQSAMEANITVSIERQEEYLDATGRTVWKVVCFAKQDNHYLPASALPVLNYTDLSIKLDALRGPRGQLFTVVSGTSLLQYRYHFSVYMTSRVSVQQYSRFETALVQVWEETKEDYKNCSCVRVDIVNQEEVVDAKGVSYWKLVYYLHVNKTLVESLTSVDINQTLLTQHVSTILRPTGQSYQTVTVEEQSVIRSMFTQAIFLRTEVGLFDINTVSSAIKSYWQSVYEEWFTCGCLDVNFSRQQSYLVLKDEKWITVWRLEYVILVDQTLVDRETIHVINDTMLQQIFSAMTSISGDVYQAEEVTSDVLVEYRWHFPLYVSREVKVTDFIHFEEAVEAVWSSSIYIEEHSVTITNQEEFVDKHGKSLWKLVVFIRNDTTYLDSSVCSPINATKVVAKLAEMNVTGARGSYDVISVDRSVVLHRYDVMIPVFLNIHVYTEDIVRIRRVLVATWELVYQEFYKDFVLDVEIIRQEDFISVKGGDVAKLVYILKSNGTIQSSTRLPQLNTTDIQAKLQTDLRTARYSVVTDVTTLVAYEQHFQLTLTQPLLQADRMIIQSQLEEAWMLSKNVSRSDVSVTITSQEELTAVENHKSLSLWRVLYLVKYKGKVTSAVVETDITNSSLYESLNVTRNDTREKYVDSLYTGDTLSYTIYRHLFAVHCEQKIAVESYDSIASGIVSAWKNVTNKSVEVEIIGQEKIYSARRYVWKLSYSVTYESDIVRSDTTRGPDVETFQQHLKISSLFGQSYKLVKVTNERRVSYALSIFLDKRIMLTFQDMFLGTLKAVWTKTHGIASTDTDIEFQGYERFLDEHKVSVWRHVCFVRVNGEVVNSAEFTQLDMREVQEALDTTFESTSMYRVLDTVVQSSYRDYSLQYSVYFRGRPGRLLLRELTTALLVAWIGKYSHTAGPEELFKPEVTDRKEAVAVNGMTLTQVTYFMTLGERPRDPLTIPAPSAQDIARDVNSTLGAQAYTGDISLIHEYSFLFSVDLRGLPIYLDSIEISKSLSEIYTMAHFVDVSVDILKMERYSGSFGVPVTKVLYTVRGNDTILDPGLITNSLGSLITAQSPQQQWRMYLGDVYRLEVIYSLTVTMELRKTDKTMIEAAIARAFVDNRTSSCSSCVTSVSIVHGQAYVTDNGVRLTRISYTVSMDNEELQSWRDVQPSQEVLQQYLTQSDRRFEMWTASAIPVDTLYIVSSANATLDVVKPILSLAWMSVLNGSVVINATEDRSYVDEDWVGLVRVDYTVSMDSAIAKNDNSAELTAAHLRFLLQLKTLQMSRGTSRKLRRMYVKGKRSELTEDKLHQAVVLSWLQHNPDLNKTDLGVAIKPESKRQKRAATNSLKLVDKDGSYVTAVLYTVSVNGEEPQGLFVEAPAPETIDSHLKNQTGAGLCNCTPSLSHNLTVAGNLSDKDKGALEEALKDAFVAANPGLKKDDLDVQITNTKAKKDENGNMVTDVEYTVSHNGGHPVEDLVSPTEEQTENSLKKHGLNVPDKTKKETTGSNDNWKIIVGVVVGIAGFVVLCSAVAHIYIKRRRRKAESLQKREDGIRQNEFDKEHFSEPVNFNNPSFDNNRHPLDPFSTRSV